MVLKKHFKLESQHQFFCSWDSVSECFICFLVHLLVRSGKGGPRKGDACLSESFQRRNDHSQRKVHGNSFFTVNLVCLLIIREICGRGIPAR